MTGMQYVWGQSWFDTSISTDSGDFVLGLRPGVYTSGTTELCMMIDGDYYSMGKKVLHEGNWSNYCHPTIFKGSNIITTPANDCGNNWKSYGSLYTTFYSKTGQLNNQPSQYGLILGIHSGTNSTEMHQLWFTQPNGSIYHRGGNGDSATSFSGYTWKKLWQEGDAVTGAVWNDYAEYRESDCEEFGYVLCEKGDDTLTKTTERLSHFAGVSSDTWGFSQGKTEQATTPIAVAGRVLVYPYQNKMNYKPGDCVCAAPGGTVDIMTREEVIQYPDRIVGTVSCVPDYEEWGGGEGADREPVQVNGRIWIKVK